MNACARVLAAGALSGLLAGALALSAAGPAVAQSPYSAVYTPRPQASPAQEALIKAVRLDQKMNAQIPLDANFNDEAGQAVKLGDYFGKKPVALIMIQFQCTMLCTEEMNVLMESLKKLTFTPGKQFNLLVVSIDPREKAELAAGKKAAYVEALGRPEAAAGWHFLTGSKAEIDRLADAVGYHYVYDATTDQYAHPDGVMIATPEGKLARYFVRLSYPPRDLRLSMVEASRGKVGTVLDQVALLCFHYNPATGKYGLALLGVLRLAGIATLVGLAIGLVALKQWDRVRVRTTTPATEG